MRRPAKWNGQPGWGLLDIFVIGSPYSGSTLLANALNGHRLIANAGEMSACFPEFPLGAKTPFCPVCSAAARPCPVWSPEFIDAVRRSGPRESRSLFRKRIHRPVVVDSSKYSDWLEMAWDPEGAAATAVVVVSRNPFAYHASNRRRTGAQAEESAGEWAYCYDRIFRWLEKTGVPGHWLHYDLFAMAPALALSKLLATFGLPWDSGALRFWERSVHALNGNAGAYMWYPEFSGHAEFEKPEDAAVASHYRVRPFGGWADRKWHGALTDEEIRTMLAGEIGEAVRSLCGRMGYDVDVLAGVARAGRER